MAAVMFGNNPSPAQRVAAAPAAPVAESAAPRPPAPEADAMAEAMYGAPAEYDLSAPEGYGHLIVDTVKQAEFTALARSMGLSQQKVRSLLELHVRSAYGAPKGKR